MKRFSIFALAAVAMFVGCTKDIDTDIVKDEIVRGELVTKTVVIEDTRVERDDVTGKLSWNEGDQVAVVLESDGAYSIDENKYTINFVNGEAQLEIPANTVYAIYPASIVKAIETAKAKDENEQEYVYQTGNVTLDLPDTYTVATPEAIFNHNPMRGVISGEKIVFKNLMGYIKVPLTGNNSLKSLTVKSEIFKGFKPLSRTATIDASDTNAGLAMSTNNSARAYVKVKFSTPINLSTSPAVYVPVPANTYANLALVAESENGATSIYAKNSHTVNRSKIKPVSTSAINVTASTPSNPTLLSGTSGDSKMDYANTYIVPPTAGEYVFEAKLADGTELAGGVTAEIVWAEEAGMFNNIHYNPSENTISFKTNGQEGNALIALSKNDGSGKTIVWSWLLWCTDQPEVISIVGGDDGKTYKVMDRVIGATWAPNAEIADERTSRGWSTTDMPYMMNGSVSSQDATNGCGLYYQYQNMIPYPRINNIDATSNESTSNRHNTRVAVQYGFHQYCQYWTTSTACSTVSVDTNGQYRTAASYNLSYEYYSGNAAWCYTPLKGHANNAASYSQTPEEGVYCLWGGCTAAASTLTVKTTHDPCPAGYIIDNYSGMYHYMGATPVARKGYVRNPNDSDVHSATTGYKFYGMFLNGCKDSKGGNTTLYTPTCSTRNQTICKTVGGYANMGYIYVYNTNGAGVETFTYTQSSKEYTGYKAGNNQFGASASSGTAIGNPWGGNAKKITNAQAYVVRCRKAGN